MLSTTQKIILAFAAIFLAAFTTGSALLATRAWDPLWNPYRPSPERVIPAALHNIQNVQTYHIKQNLFAEIKDSEKTIVSFTLSAQSDIDQSDQNNLQSQTTASLDFLMPATAFQLKAETKTLENVSYIKLENIAGNIKPYLLLAGIDIDQINNRWLRIDPVELLALSGLEQEMTVQELQKQSALRKEMQGLFLSSQFYQLQQELPDEEFNGQKAYHYVMEIKLGEMLEEIFAKVFEQEEVNKGDVFAAEIAKGAIKGMMGTTLQKIGPIASHLWIDKKTLYLNKAAIQKTIDLNQEIGRAHV